MTACIYFLNSLKNHPKNSRKLSEKLLKKSGRKLIQQLCLMDDEFDIEIQRTDEGASEKRARYNSSLIDSNKLKKGESVQALPETCVIFFIERDVLGGKSADLLD